MKAPLADSPLTLDKYPNKPLLLMSILDLIGSGYFRENRFFLCPELNDVFDRYWEVVLPHDATRNIRMPFEKLASSSFWHLTEERHPFSRARVATFDPELFAICLDPPSRAALWATLVERHFAPEIREALRDAAQTTSDSFRYGEALLHRSFPTTMQVKDAVRSQAFRTTVVRAYDYRCTICGIRIFSPEGRTAVDAAHIEPWSVGHDDDPTNGLGLCKLCHWGFDHGMLAVSERFTVLTSKRLLHDDNLGGHLVTCAGRGIFLPPLSELHPSLEKLRWHRENLFVG